MRESVNKANDLFARIFCHCIMTIISGEVRQEGRESYLKGKRHKGDKGRRKKRKKKKKHTSERTL